jgi:hypothetical protein
MFPTNSGICFSFKANSKGLNLNHKCTVRARWEHLLFSIPWPRGAQGALLTSPRWEERIIGNH